MAMNETTTKEKVLKQIRNALISKQPSPFQSVDFESPIYADRDEDPSVIFVEEFTANGGKFLYCENEDELMENIGSVVTDRAIPAIFCTEERLRYLLNKAEIPATSDESKIDSTKATLTFCEFLIARIGGIMVSSKTNSGRKLSVIPEIHLVVAYSSQLVRELKDALKQFKQRQANNDLPSLITLISGPSRTADIEKTLVMGAHGPKEIYLFFVDDMQ